VGVRESIVTGKAGDGDVAVAVCGALLANLCSPPSRRTATVSPSPYHCKCSGKARSTKYVHRVSQEGTPSIPASSNRRLSSFCSPQTFAVNHTRNGAGANLSGAQYGRGWAASQTQVQRRFAVWLCPVTPFAPRSRWQSPPDPAIPVL